MERNEIEVVIERLRNREIEEFLVLKENFLAFREVLVKEEDFKFFRGVAMHQGATMYSYMDEARS